MVSLPVNPEVKLTACENPDDVCNQKFYQAIVGSFLYLFNKTRPDIAFAVSSAAQFYTSPTKQYYAILNGTQQLESLHNANSSSNEIVGFSDLN